MREEGYPDGMNIEREDGNIENGWNNLGGYVYMILGDQNTFLLYWQIFNQGDLVLVLSTYRCLYPPLPHPLEAAADSGTLQNIVS